MQSRLGSLPDWPLGAMLFCEAGVGNQEKRQETKCDRQQQAFKLFVSGNGGDEPSSPGARGLPCKSQWTLA